MSVNFNVQFESSDQSFQAGFNEAVHPGIEHLLDSTLSLPGKAADAAAVGAALEKKQNKALGNQEISEANFTYGKGNFVGLKGYYYSNIDFEAKTITLSTKQTVADGNGIHVAWEVGDKVTIVNNSHYDRCSTITAINGNVITVDSFPFTEVVVILPDWDDYVVFVPDKPEAGVVDLGRFAMAIGEGIIATERSAGGTGRGHIIQAKYGFAVNRGNIIRAYAGFSSGCFNEIEEEALYASTDGIENTATAPITHAGGSNSKATKDGADADGYKCEADGEWSLARNYKTKATAPYAVSINRETSADAEGSLSAGLGTKTVLKYSAWFGKYNAPTANHLFGVGMGTSDANRANAFVVRKDGDSDFCGHRARNVANAVADTDAVSLRQVKQLIAELRAEIAKLKDELAN